MNSISRFYLWQENYLAFIGILKSPAIFVARLYVAKIFFLSGLTKLRDWDSTLFLFQEEYQVPLLPPELAAYLGTSGELLFPILLTLGLFTRPSAIGLFFVNFVAAISLPDLTQAALSQHLLWGTLLAVCIILGGGRFTVDFYALKGLENINSKSIR